MALGWARQEKLFILLIGFFVLFLFLLPLPSHAKFVETGPPCTPEVIPDFGDIPTPSVVTCPWCPAKLGSTKIRLNWELDSKDLPDPLCVVSCSNPDNQGCAGAWGKDSDGVNLTLFQAPLTSDWNLKTNDEIHMINVRGGNKYMVKCWGRDSNGSIVNQDYMEAVPARVEDDCRVPCEVPFQTIKRSIESQRTSIITEVSGNDWFNIDDMKDDCNSVAFSGSKGPCLGSGDTDDIKVWMEESQMCQFNFSPDSPPPLSTDDVLDALSYIKQNIEDGYPVLISYAWRTNYGPPSPPEKISGLHSLIAYDFRMSQSQEAGYRFEVDMLDPNKDRKTGSHKKTLYCISRRRDTSVDFSTLSCTDDPSLAPIDPVWWDPKEIFREKMPYRDPTSEGINLILRNARDEAIKFFPVSNEFKNRDLISWVRNNTPEVDNFMSATSPFGNCYGWTRTFLSIAYLGDFVGTDYHPDDGKYVGEHCGENHYPIQKKSSFIGGAEDWLANVWSVWQGLF